eukprot:Nk52_evm1s2560 gene=Nk52_evmTU1s2560
MCEKGEIAHSPAIQLEQVTDSVGAGDTFVAATIFAELEGYNIPSADLIPKFGYSNTLPY